MPLVGLSRLETADLIPRDSPVLIFFVGSMFRCVGVTEDHAAGFHLPNHLAVKYGLLPSRGDRIRNGTELYEGAVEFCIKVGLLRSHVIAAMSVAGHTWISYTTTIGASPLSWYLP